MLKRKVDLSLSLVMGHGSGLMKNGEPAVSSNKAGLGSSRRGPANDVVRTAGVRLVKVGETSCRPVSEWRAKETSQA